MITTLLIATGIWRGVLSTPGGELPFQMQIDKTHSSYTLTVINGEERLTLDEITLRNDSLLARFPVYESELHLKINNDHSMEGSFINLTRKTNGTIPLKLTHGEPFRFRETTATTKSSKMEPRYEVTFSKGTADSSSAIGVFSKTGNKVTGTFLTPSGDYRFLEGSVIGDSLFLSTFNGVFVYLFKAKILENRVMGTFYSGTHYQTSWEGIANPKAELPDPESLTTISDKELPLNFTFPDTDSLPVSLSDPKFANKVIVIQILGSWCPNCLDETTFLAPFYDRYREKGVEIIGLAFEKTDDFSRAAANVRRLQNRFSIHYQLLIASNRDKIKATMPRLNNFIGFPTTIILDKNHKVRKIHAGFSGQATGIEFERYKDAFELYINKLVAE